MRVLAGDIGGTKTLLAVVELSAGPARVLAEERYASADFTGLSPMVNRFLEDRERDFAATCFAVAGPVVDGSCKTTNLPWELSEAEIAESTGLSRPRLINDFLAVGHSIAVLQGDDFLVLQAGVARPEAPIAVLGAGTGLGECYLTWNGRGYDVHASEGGHASFAPRTDEELGLLGFLRRKHGRVSVERVVSGPGLVSVYRYLVAEGGETESPETRRDMQTQDPAAVISERALAGTDPACARALDLWISAYGAEAGDWALKLLALGGVVVAGGIAPRLETKLGDGTFLKSFHEKGRYRELMKQLPVRVILNARAGLLGAAAFAGAHVAPAAA